MSTAELCVLTDVVPLPWWYSILPVILVGGVILGAALLILFGIWFGRRATVNSKTGGAIALTLASIFLLSGIWCMVLSPVVTYSQTKHEFYRPPISVPGLESWSYSFDAERGDTLVVRVDPTGVYETDSEKVFSVMIYDPDNSVVLSDTNTTFTQYRAKTVKSGLYRVEVQNPNQEAIECYVQITLSAEVTYRPLEPLGSWLILMSLPVFGLGVWASGLFEELRPYILPPQPRRA